jgi:hypothetical protein
VLIKPHVIKYASIKRLFLFCGLQDYTYSALCFFFFIFTCVEFQVRIMLHFAYSIFYIKPQTISVVEPGILLKLNKINILAEWQQTDQLSTFFNIRHSGTY